MGLKEIDGMQLLAKHILLHTFAFTERAGRRKKTHQEEKKRRRKEGKKERREEGKKGRRNATNGQTHKGAQSLRRTDRAEVHLSRTLDCS